MSRAEVTSQCTMGKMMHHLARYSFWTEAEPRLRKQVNTRAQIQSNREGGMCWMQRSRVLAAGKALYLSFLMMTSVPDLPEAWHSSELMKWAWIYICSSNTKDKWLLQTHSRNGHYESCFQGHFLSPSDFCFCFRCLELNKQTLLPPKIWFLYFQPFLIKHTFLIHSESCILQAVNTVYLHKTHILSHPSHGLGPGCSWLFQRLRLWTGWHPGQPSTETLGKHVVIILKHL